MIAIFVKPAMSHHQSFLSYYILEDGHGAGFHCLSLNMFNRSITLWLFNIAMENGPFIDGLPIKNGDCPWLC